MRQYENPQVTSENRLPPRSYYIPGGCSSYQLLNGTWDFAFFSRDIDVPEQITQWDKTPVPSCWQIEGYEPPNYSIYNYPFSVDPPYVPTDNPCGVYQREFMLEKKWGRVYFVLEGVSSCAYVYVNDSYVGFTQGSHLQAEFDITDFVIEGSNTLRIHVLKWCCGSYLEDQDYMRMNGIFRDCYLLQRPEGHITDVQIIPNDKTIDIQLDGEAELKIFEGTKLLCQASILNRFVYAPEKPILWNAEKPFLYKVEISRNGEVLTFMAGLRSIAVSDQYELLINGVSVKLHGVNHHDTSKYRGWCQTDEELRQDLLLMKDLNINCIRTSHYPPTPRFMQMCDELGFYVILETDLETHGFISRFANKQPGTMWRADNDWPCTRPEWKQEFLERMQRALEYHKNFAGVIFWSTGNESSHGTNQVNVLRWLQTRDPSRLRHCEDASRLGEPRNADVFSGMYLSPQELIDLANNTNIDRPVYLCEYAHAMGNGPGDVYRYNEIFDSYPKLIGGCVWEWADHVVTVDGVEKYGGDFPGEPKTHGKNTCCDGMVFADRSFRAGTLEVKKSYQPIRSKLEKGVLRIYNRLDFTDLNEYTLTLTIEADGKEISHKELDLECPPHCWAEIPLEYTETECRLGVYLNCYLRKSGKCYATEQHPLPCKIVPEKLCDTPAQLKAEGRFLIAEGKRFRYCFDTHYGSFTSMVIDGKEQIAEKMELTVFRAPVDNDRDIMGRWINISLWIGENIDCASTKVYGCKVDSNTITADFALSGISRAPVVRYSLRYSLFADGRVDVALDAKVREDAYWLPRMGFEMALPGEYNAFSYYGKGPMENYIDLHNCATVSRYESTAEKEYVPYVRPQDHGNHTRVQELTIGNLTIKGQDTFECCVSRFSMANLYQANHTDELKPDGKIHLRIDYKNSGVGSAACGPELDPMYRLEEKNVAFGFSMMPK